METLARAANRGSISTGAAGYEIDNSFVQEYNSTRNVSKTFGGFGGSEPVTTKGTISFWFKWASSTSTQGVAAWKLWRVYNSQVSIMPPGGTYDSSIYVAVNNESVLKLVSTPKFRDTSAWYHLVASFDTTQSTASDRVKIYVNGVRITDFTTANYPSQNADLLLVKENTQHHLGHDVNAGKPYAYFADMYYIHDQAKDVTDFGEFDANTGIWKPIEYTGTFGTHGYYWDFSNTSNYAEDQSGNGNDGQSLNTTAAMQSTDTPTNNFCTINTLQPYVGTTVITNGATKMGKTAATWQTAFATMGITSGKWYWEYKTSEADNMTGIADIDTFSSFDTSAYLGQTATSWGYYAYNGKYINNSTETTYGNTFNSTNIIGVALDMDNNKLYFAKDNTWQNSGDPTSGATGTGAISITSGIYYTPSASIYDNGDEQEFNFGGYTTISIASAETDANGYGTFEYAPPSGYYALCTKNLAEFG